MLTPLGSPKDDDTFVKNHIFAKTIISYTMKLQMLILYTPPTQNHYFSLFEKAYFCSKSLRRHMKSLCDRFFSVFTSLGPPKCSKNELRKLKKRIISRF